MINGLAGTNADMVEDGMGTATQIFISLRVLKSSMCLILKAILNMFEN